MPHSVAGKTAIDHYVISKVKEMRLEQGFTQAALAIMLDVSATFIGDIESPVKPQKYNVAHLNKLAEIFVCSPRDFLPEKPLT